MFGFLLGLLIGRITHLGIAGGVAFVLGSLFGLLPLLPVFWTTYLFLEALGAYSIYVALFPDGMSYAGPRTGVAGPNAVASPNGIPPWAAQVDAENRAV